MMTDLMSLVILDISFEVDKPPGCVEEVVFVAGRKMSHSTSEPESVKSSSDLKWQITFNLKMYYETILAFRFEMANNF